MSLDSSLRGKAALGRHRNVLSRAERVELLQREERWTDELSPIGMPKVGHRKPRGGKKKVKGEGEAGATPGAATPGAAPAAPAPASKK